MIRTENLSKIFKVAEVETKALKEINIAVEQGEFVAVMGPSGCGKSTLLNILGMLDVPTHGSYWFKGRNVALLGDYQRTQLRKGKIGFVFQSFNLIDELTIYENIELPLVYMKLKGAQRKQLVNQALERMRISHRRNNFPVQLSGGQQQRAAIARAVVANPELILADEPTGNLDSVNGGEVMNLFAELNADGTTIIMVTHSPTDADKANRIVQLFDGLVLSENMRKAI
ncbi:MAG: ABC transporter ATP-binding protein [Bacteroidales bacterium]|nr:ABC transporter ATP-binding protein [Bacteroidales bacterium]